MQTPDTRSPVSPSVLRLASDAPWDVLRPHFDREFYLATNPEVRELAGDSLEHYFNVGWKEGRDPSAAFSTTFYLLAHPDVAQTGVNPLLQYVLHGASEGRLTMPGLLPLPPATVRASFDAEFYLSTQRDVAELGIDPLAHFLTFGWREGRNPSAEVDILAHVRRFPGLPVRYVHPFFHLVALSHVDDPDALVGPLEEFPAVRALLAKYFDADNYRSRYPDVRDAGVDPFLHFVRAGHAEWRAPMAAFEAHYYADKYRDVANSELSPAVHYVLFGRPAGRSPSSLLPWKKQSIVDSVVDARRGAWDYPSEPIAVSTVAGRLKAALNESQRDLVIAFSHDVYSEQVGGIQIFMQDEAAELCSRGAVYLAVAPARTQLALLDGQRLDRFPVIVTLAGEKLGRLTFLDLLEIVRTVPTARVSIVIHSLLGFDPSLIASFCEGMPAGSRAYYWVHDYSAVCPSFNLLRNGVEYCAAPSSASDACAVCSHGVSRNQVAPAVRAFFERVPCQIVAPSDAAREVWSVAGMDEREIRVIPHGDLVALEDASDGRALDPRPLRVAFCGYAKQHKGWHVFQRLVDLHHGSALYEFHHFASEKSSDPRVRYHHVSVSRQRRNAMTEALVAEQIDVVVVPPIWPETFCFVAYEVLASGALLLTTRGSGNVERLARQHSEHAFVAEDPEEVFREFALENVVRRVRAMRTSARRFAFELGGGSARAIPELGRV